MTSATRTYNPVCLIRMEMPAASPAARRIAQQSGLHISEECPDAHERADEQPPRGQRGEIVRKAPAKCEPGPDGGADRLEIPPQDEIDEYLRQHGAGKEQPPRIDEIDAGELEYGGVHPREPARVRLLVVDMRNLATSTRSADWPIIPSSWGIHPRGTNSGRYTIDSPTRPAAISRVLISGCTSSRSTGTSGSSCRAARRLSPGRRPRGRAPA